MAGTPESLHVRLENREMFATGEYILRQPGVQEKKALFRQDLRDFHGFCRGLETLIIDLLSVSIREILRLCSEQRLWQILKFY